MGEGRTEEGRLGLGLYVVPLSVEKSLDLAPYQVRVPQSRHPTRGRSLVLPSTPTSPAPHSSPTFRSSGPRPTCLFPPSTPVQRGLSLVEGRSDDSLETGSDDEP